MTFTDTPGILNRNGFQGGASLIAPRDDQSDPLWFECCRQWLASSSGNEPWLDEAAIPELVADPFGHHIAEACMLCRTHDASSRNDPYVVSQSPLWRFAAYRHFQGAHSSSKLRI